ncbi:hypothetical protein HAP94_13885 [Acidithiobacillus ferrivorans]|nr:hypothetical protein [Acidithiobacillus ferrivorans]
MFPTPEALQLYKDRLSKAASPFFDSQQHIEFETALSRRIRDATQELFLPYHNVAHCLRVAITLATAFTQSPDLLASLEDWFGREKALAAIQDALIVAVYHDYRHSGAPDSEQDNMSRPLFIMRHYFKDRPHPFITFLQMATYYPYLDLHPLHTAVMFDSTGLVDMDMHIAIAHLLRDADKINFLEDHWVKDWVVDGIALELTRHQGLSAHTPGVAVQKFMDWFERESWHSPWGIANVNLHALRIKQDVAEFIANQQTEFKPL